jgi:DNA-nicking Smr family endonuclease
MRVIDLHGCHIHEGWRKFNREINEAYFDNYKRVTVITGQGSMMLELPTWAENHPRVREVMQSAPHNRGSFTILLKKKG